MAEISVSGKLPSGDGNGLVAIAQALIDAALGNSPPRIHIAVALVDCAKLTVNADTHELVPVARIRRIEVINGEEDREVLRRLMSRALDARTGREALPYNLEDELRSIINEGAVAEAQAELSAADDPCGGPPVSGGHIPPPAPAEDVDTGAWPDDLSGLDGQPGDPGGDSE